MAGAAPGAEVAGPEVGMGAAPPDGSASPKLVRRVRLARVVGAAGCEALRRRLVDWGGGAGVAAAAAGGSGGWVAGVVMVVVWIDYGDWRWIL